MTAPDLPEALLNRVVVLDVTSPYLYLGTLVGSDHRYLILEDADVHDLRDSRTSREHYVLQSREHGIRTNRKTVYVSRTEIVSLSALDDVVE